MSKTENVGSTRRNFADIYFKAAIIGGQGATQVLQWIYVAAHALVLKIRGEVPFLMVRVYCRIV